MWWLGIVANDGWVLHAGKAGSKRLVNRNAAGQSKVCVSCLTLHLEPLRRFALSTSNLCVLAPAGCRASTGVVPV